ncbi:tetratricopeptide repeat protein [Kitasatospora sp. HPMI-4]|uniref:tetratricopeptide repeat protein n=1 Tax=Kitasatospora sp. HPMI-4 TaxID=3448443 RepID=UPI003F1CC7EA
MGIFGRRKKRQAPEQQQPSPGMIEVVLAGNMRVQVPSSGPLFEDMRRQFQAAGEAGDPKAMRYLAALLNGSGDPHGAAEWWERSAEGGDVESAAWLAGYCLQFGEPEEALAWLRQAAEGGHMESAFNLASFHVGNGDLAEAKRWFTTVAESGTGKSAEAARELAMLIREGGE